MLTVVLFAIWIIVLDARAGVRGISPSLVEMARSYGATPLAGVHQDLRSGRRCRRSWPASASASIRAVKGVIIGQLLVSVVGFGHLFELYSSNFLMEHMWALLLVLFALRLPDRRRAWLARAEGRVLRRLPQLMTFCEKKRQP